jgi:serine/threonine protein kinase
VSQPLPQPADPSVARFRKVKELFHQAVELEADGRRALLDGACADDPELRAELAELLASHDEAAGFLEEPATAFLAEEWTAEREARTLELPGARIGPYEIDGELGRGGMGSVYLAHRAGAAAEGASVAIKLVPAALAAGFVLDRFRAERRILSGLDHPNIARLFEAGTTPAGSPFFVMEYVEGEPIDLYCQRRRLSTSRRVQLFRQVCAAVQHAHQRLIVHRDLKPANILVTAEGIPKLLDFGIAKLLASQAAETTSEATAPVLRVMTPEYASPEQVLGEPITVASDVYTLGVLLYQLLTGRRPYVVASRHPHQMARVICEEEPPRPSAVVGWSEEVDSTESIPLPFSRHEESSLLLTSRRERLRRRLSGDLDNIVMKALRKEPGRRYGSVDQLSEDLRRHLEGLPISAHPETIGSLTVKFMQRNRGRLLIGVPLILALVGGLAVLSFHARRAEARLARTERQVLAFLLEIDRELAATQGAAPARKVLARRALIYLDGLNRRATGDPELASALAAGYRRAADALRGPPEGEPQDPALVRVSEDQAERLEPSVPKGP